ncbi:TAXI family TRAP transporter solute-binding subunit [Streptomyces yaanensis]|uniref:TAXI family TRAP transporter solute-binding subunit n=1 Tax=Streptomyces yaanensis TaxID=1142239 RepID=A0ABV7SMR3_9ACTN|nr:TAXI family TRAP transporter solute-binding subunit [Streptomyces sp. CGMCC 4.7035]WNC00412.1 TAXI family TRAP transporter solute-binding subunit [Streptomyces sp. CGMCC 4.7035]
MSEAPVLGRPITLHFRGDWGQANIHRMCGWIAQEIGDRAPEGSRFAIWSGRGGLDQIEALRGGAVDIAIATPTAAMRMLHRAGNAKGIASLGVVGQRDRLVVAVDAALPVNTVADLGAIADQLTVATSPDDGVNLIGFAAHKALRLAGVDPDKLTFRYDERPFPAVARFAAGEANVLIHEAVMTPAWQRIDRVRPVNYLPWGDEVLRSFAAQGWPDAVVEAGYLPGLHDDLRTLDFSDFAVLCREDLEDDVAALATWCMVMTRRALEAQYAHLPADHSPVTYPLVPADMARTPLPLHPASARMYEALGNNELVDGAPIWK